VRSRVRGYYRERQTFMVDKGSFMKRGRTVTMDRGDFRIDRGSHID